MLYFVVLQNEGGGDLGSRAEQARVLFEQGKSLTDIAKELDVSAGTVRSWKSRGRWGSNAATQRNVAKPLCNDPDTATRLIASVEANEALTDQQRAFCLHYVKTFNATASYLRAYGCSYDAARAHGYELLRTVAVRAEVKRLKQIRAEAILAGPEDVVDRYMRIAFSDLSDFVEWGRVQEPVIGPYGPIMVTDPATGAKVQMTQKVNDVRFRESSEVDGTLVSEVKLGKDGASIKLADRMKALAWLSDYFGLNPMDKHRREYDARRLEIELIKAQAAIKDDGQQEMPDDGFTAALNAKAAKDWQGGDDNVGGG